MRLRASRSLLVEPALPPALEPLRRLSENLFWTWNTDAVALFERIDRDAWQETGHNPVRLLQGVSVQQWEVLADDDGFRRHLERVVDAFDAYMARPALVQVPGTSEREVIAYFSLEFALAESLPNYSGGLGVLAGDHLKSASDLGIPLVGVGLLYHEGYFRQQLGPDGWQHEDYSVIDLAGQPLKPIHGAKGEPMRVAVPFDGREVYARVWRLDVGKTPLYLLDTNIEPNSAQDRQLTARLYGGDSETRIQQEMVLGIGGVRALHALGLHPAVCHMNEGHSALLGVERIRMMMEEDGVSFAEARIPVTSATVFTTHTAVAAGIDLFAPDLLRRYLGHYYASMGLDDHGFLGLGRTNPTDDTEPFSMALLGLRLSGYRNGVSKLHQRVSRRLWEAAWPNLPLEQVPIEAVTNGVHLPTWVAHEIGDLYDRYVGPGWRDDPVNADWQHVSEIPDEELWRVHERQRERLVLRARAQHAEDLVRRGRAVAGGSTGQPLDNRALTIGFARRFAGYKRATLLFRDPGRLAAILNNPERPVQFIFSGKAHPRDEPAKALIREVLQFSRLPEFRDRIILLERYDIDLARSLVQGADVWLNTPLRPLEASGTSGMKSVANGGLHMSVMDGWWWEAYRPGLGWAIGRDRLDDDPEAQDAFDADSVYDLIENELVPAFYDRDPDGIPHAWTERMKASIEAFAPVFNTSRMVAEYAGTAYEHAAASWGGLRESGLAAARDQAAWLERVTAGWSEVKVCAVEDDATETGLAGTPVTVTVQIHPGPLAPEDLRVDVVFGPATPGGELAVGGTEQLAFRNQGNDGMCRFSGTFRPLEGGRIGYAIRVLPQHPALHDVFGPGLALWA
ncbi:MAG: glycosyltransferase family 1 protein [Chloroflexi bacterium]|nr:glycosyltransferase family 1 protein [Chloroflexota bacterium]PWB45087.1 MAG: alpha-glucan phosphorylase [Dehalococcoidia bacterium]